MSDPFAEFREYERQYKQLTGGTVPAVGDNARRAEERRLATEAAGRFAKMPPDRQFMAGARQTVGSMPLIKRIPPVRRFSNPEKGTPEAQDLSDFRTGHPRISSGFGFAGNAAPYVGAAGLLPGAFRSLAGAMTGNATIGASDAYLGGENPVYAGLMDAAATIPGWAIGRLMTPRGKAATAPVRAEFNANRTGAIDDVMDESVGALNTALGGLRTSSRGARGRFVTRPPTSETLSEMGEATQRMGTAGQALETASTPTMRAPTIGEGGANSIQRSIDNATQSAILGLLAAGGGQHVGLNPFLTGAAGMLAPRVAQAGVSRVNSAVEGFNRRFLSADAPKLPRRALFRYLNNQTLSDRDRAIVHAMSVPTTEEVGSNVASSLSPRLIDMLSRALEGQQAPTPGGN